MSNRSGDNTAWLAALGKDRNRGKRSWYIALLLSVLFGWCGLDRFYLGQFGFGLLKFCTVGGLLVLWIADIVLVLTDAITDVDGNRLRR